MRLMQEPKLKLLATSQLCFAQEESISRFRSQEIIDQRQIPSNVAIEEKQLVAAIEKGFVFFAKGFWASCLVWEKKMMMARGMGRFPSSTCHSTPFAKFFAKCEFDVYDFILVILVVFVLLWIG